MRFKLLKFLFLGILSMLIKQGAFAQFDSSKKGTYAIENVFADTRAGDTSGSWLQLEGSPDSYTRAKLVLAPRTFSPHGRFALFRQKQGYQVQVQFSDKSWGNWEVEKTFKKDGARIFLEKRTVDGKNMIINPQCFLIQKAPEGYYIRTMDGRYLWYNTEKKVVEFTGKQPESLIKAKQSLFMWFILKSGGF